MRSRWLDPIYGPSLWLPTALGTAAIVGLASAVHPVLGVLAAAGAVVALVLVQYPEAFVHLLVLSMFVESLGIGPLRIGRVLAAGVLVFIAARIAGGNWRPPHVAPAGWIPVALLVLWAAATLLWAEHTGGWVFAMGQLGLAVAFFAGFALFLRSPEHLRHLLRTFVLGALGAATIGIAQAAAGARATALQGDPNIFSLYQVAAIPAAVALADTARANTTRALWLAAGVPLALSVLASQSRGGMLSMAFVVSFLLWREASSRWGRVLAALAVAAALAGGVVAVATVPGLSQRADIERIARDRGSGRADIWLVAWRQAAAHPYTGIGAGNFKERSLELLAEEPGVELPPNHHLFDLPGIEVHNLYLEMFTEYGFPGLMLLGLLGVATVRNVGAARRRWPGSAPLSALLWMLFVFGVGATFLSVINNKLLWMVVGSAAGLRSRSAVDRVPVPAQPPVLEGAR